MSPLVRVGYTILVGNGKGERRPYWGLTCTWDHAAEGDDEMKVMWMWMSDQIKFRDADVSDSNPGA